MISIPVGTLVCGLGHIYHWGNGIWVLSLRPGRLLSTEGGVGWGGGGRG